MRDHNKLQILKADINKMKRQPAEWEKIFANHISNKGLIFRLDKELNSKKKKKTQSNPILKWTEDLNTHFPKTDGQQIHH